MIALPHSIRQQDLEVDAGTEETALALRGRLSELNRRRLLPLIERVFDELAIPGRRVRIRRLEIDLGAVPLAGFEATVEERLERELRRVLGETLRRIDTRPGEDELCQPEELSRLELLEHYLLYGTLPFWAPRAPEFSFAALFAELAAEDPGGLAGLVRRAGRRSRVIERLVTRLSEAQLERLVEVLEPESAALILAYLVDLRQIHRVERLVTLGDDRFPRRQTDRDFAEVLWILTLTYLVEEPGTQYNRRSFVKSLLWGIAASRGLDVHDLLTTIQLGLERTRKKRPLKSSLPAVLGELIRDQLPGAGKLGSPGRASSPAPGAAAGPGPEELPGLELLEHYLLYGTLPFRARASALSFEALFAELAAGDAGGLADIVRRHGRRGRVIERLVARLSDPELERLVAVLEPEHAAPILACVVDLRQIHRLERLVAMGDEAFAEALWTLTLTYLVRDPGSQFNRKSFVKSLVWGIAESRGLDVHDLLTTIQLGLERTRKNHPLDSSLPAVLGELARDQLPGEGPVGHRLGSPDSGREPGRDEAGLVLERYDLVEILRYWMRYGVLPWSAAVRDAGWTVDRALAALPGLPHTLLHAVFAGLDAARPGGMAPLYRLARAVPEERLVELVIRLLPAADPGRSPGSYLAALAARADRNEDRSRFFVRVIAALLDGRPADFETLATQVEARVDAGEPALPEDLGEWRVHVLESVLVSRLRSGAPGAQQPTPADLLEALLSRKRHPASIPPGGHPADIRRWLLALGDVPDLRTALVDHVAPRLFRRSLDLLCPESAGPLEAFAEALDAVPVRYRPRSSSAVRRAILGEVLRRSTNGRTLEEVFRRVLRDLFGASLPVPVRRLLSRRGDVDAALKAAVPETSARRRPPPAPEAETELGTAAVREAVLAWLRGDSRTDGLSDGARRHALRELLDAGSDELDALLREHGGDRSTRRRWIAILPESILARLSLRLAPRRHRVLLDAAEVLCAAWRETAPGGRENGAARREMWSVLLEFLASHPADRQSPEKLVESFSEHFADTSRAASPGPGSGGPEAAADFFQSALRIARTAGHASLTAVFHRAGARLPDARKPDARKPGARKPGVRKPGARKPGARKPSATRSERAPADRPARSRPSRAPRNPTVAQAAFSMGRSETEETPDLIYVDNAGLVLASPFLPHLFGALGLVRQDEEGRTSLGDRSSMSRAVHLLQVLVDGRTSAPEPLLVLNKILCGVPTGAPVDREIEPTEEEVEVCEKLLKSVLANWKSLEGTSIEGLRETFLQRQGRLSKSSDPWKLQVQRKTLDVLVDQVPWGFSVILHPWMAQPLHVSW